MYIHECVSIISIHGCSAFEPLHIYVRRGRRESEFLSLNLGENPTGVAPASKTYNGLLVTVSFDTEVHGGRLGGTGECEWGLGKRHKKEP